MTWLESILATPNALALRESWALLTSILIMLPKNNKRHYLSYAGKLLKTISFGVSADL